MPLISTFGAASSRGFGGIGASSGTPITSVAFVAGVTDDTIYSLDVSDPSNPVLLDTLSGSTFNGVSGIAADPTNKRIYFCTRNTTRRVGVIDVSNPKSMSLGTTFNVGSEPLFSCDIDVTNSRLWVASETYVYGINVSNQSSFSNLGNRGIGGTNDYDISVDPDTGYVYANASGGSDPSGRLSLIKWTGTQVDTVDDQNHYSGYGGLGIAPSGNGDNVFIAISSGSQEQVLLKEAFTSGQYTDSITNASSFNSSGNLDGARLNVFHRSRNYLYTMSGANSHKLVTISVSNINSPSLVRTSNGGTTYLNQPMFGCLDDTNDKLYITNYDANGSYLSIANVSGNASFIAKYSFTGSEIGQVKVINYDPAV